MDSTGKSSSGSALAIVPVGAATTPTNAGSTRSIALVDMNQQEDVEDEDGLHVVEAEGGGGGSSSRQRKYARLSQEQTDQLEAVFQQNHSPDTTTKEELADRIGMTLDKVHIWFRSRRQRFNQPKRDADHKQQVSKLLEDIQTLEKENASLTKDKISLAEKCISLHEQNNSLTKEKHRLESELAEIKETYVPPMMLPVNGLPQVFVELCRVCSPIFTDTAAAAGALQGSQKGMSASASKSASTSTAKPCPDCLNILENMETMVAMVASFAKRAKRQHGGVAAATTTPTMPPPSSSGGRGGTA